MLKGTSPLPGCVHDLRFALHKGANKVNLLAVGFVALRFGWPLRPFGFGWPPSGFEKVAVAAPCSSSPRPGLRRRRRRRRRRRSHCPRHPRPLPFDLAFVGHGGRTNGSPSKSFRTRRSRSFRPNGSKTAAGTTPSGACARHTTAMPPQQNPFQGGGRSSGVRE